MLAASLTGAAASAGAKRASHALSLGVNLLATGAVAIATARRAKTRSGTYWHRKGPMILTIASVFLLCADPIRHVLQDEDVWTTGSSMYRDDCEHADVRCLSAVGWIFTLCTYFGFACLIAGAAWNADAFGKIGREWNRRRHAGGDSSNAGDDADGCDEP